MLWLVIKKEILEHLLSLRFAISAILCFVVIISSIWVLTRDYKENLLDYHTNLVMHHNEVLAYGERQTWRFGRDGVKVDKPLNPLEIFFSNPQQRGNVTAKVGIRSEPEFERAHEENPIIYLFSIMDLRFFIGIIMGLLALVFSYDAVSGEKESGTLRLVLSYSIPRDTLLLGKWIGGYLSLIFPFLLAIISSLIIVVAFPDVRLHSQHWLALGIILLISLLYISALYSLGIFVSTRTSMASTSITTLLLLWIVMVLVIPNISPYIASQIHPLSSMQELEREKMELQRDTTKKWRQEWIEYREECEKNNIPREKWREGFRDREEKLLNWQYSQQEKIENHFKKALAKQVNISKNISRISPFSSLTLSITELAGISSQEMNRFWKEAVRYQGKLRDYLYENRSKWQEQGWRNIDLSDYPRFHYEESRLIDRINNSLIDILILLMWSVIFFMGAYLSFLRYDVR